VTLPASRRTPGYRFAQSFAGLTNAGTKPKTVYILGEILAAGSMSEGEVSDIITDPDVAQGLAGARSIAAFMVRQGINQRPGGDVVPIKIVAVAEPAGGTAADQTFTFANNADSDTTVTIRIAGHEIDTIIATGNTPTNSGDALEAAIELYAENNDLPVSANNVAGTVTVTCKQKGTIGNQIATVVETWVGEGTQTLTAGGATLTGGLQDPDLTTTTLPNIEAVDTDFLACSMIDATNLENVRAHMDTKGGSTNQMGGFFFYASRDATLGNITTIANTLHGNGAAQRGHCLAYGGSEGFPPAMAARDAVAHASVEDTAQPLNGITITGIRAPAVTDRYTVTELETLLSYGVTPLRTDSATATVGKIIRSVVIRTDLLDPLDITKIATMDEARDLIRANFIANGINQKKLKKAGEPIFTNGCVTAESVMSLAKAVLYKMEEKDQIQGMRSGMLTDRFKATNAGNGRIELIIPEDVVDGAHDVAGDIVLVLS
jgi:phage tail sheath gpL-like